MEIALEPPFASASAESTLILVVTPLVRSLRKTSGMALVSPATRFVAEEVNTTKRPSAEMRGVVESPSP